MHILESQNARAKFIPHLRHTDDHVIIGERSVVSIEGFPQRLASPELAAFFT